MLIHRSSHRALVDGIMVVVERVITRFRLKREEGARALMPTYISFLNFTDQGVRTANESVQRRDRADALAEKHGASIEQVYWTVGPYDLVTIIEAPDEESATSMLLELGSAGNLRTTTLRAYGREEMSRIIQRLG